MTPPEIAGWNLALRFGLEIAALAGLSIAAWRVGAVPWRWAFVMAAPLVAAVAWITFNVVDDPSRSGAAPVEVPGGVRLLLELAVFGAGSAGFFLGGYRTVGIAIGILVFVHYATSVPRIEWLLSA